VQGSWSDEERLAFSADVEPFAAHGLSAAITNIKAGDCCLFDTVRKTNALLRHFELKMIVLPRQARDKHRET